MAEQNTIIQLSEKNNKHSEQNSTAYNGDWTTNVENITLYKGDMIQMRSCFIDTVVQNSQLIDVEPDNDTVDYMTLGVEHGYYLCEWGSTPTDIVPAVAAGPNGSPAAKDAVAPGKPCNNRKFIPAGTGTGVVTPPNLPDQGNANERSGNGHQYINCIKQTGLGPNPEPVFKLEGFSIQLIDNKVDSGDGKYRRGFFKYVTPGSLVGEFTKIKIQFIKNGNLSGKGKKYGAHPFQEINTANQAQYIVTSDGKPLLPLLMLGQYGFLPDTTFAPPNPTTGTGGTSNKEVIANLKAMQTQDHLNTRIDINSSPVTSAGGVFKPNTYIQQFRIPAKKYQPEELAVKLSLILSNVNKKIGGSNHQTESEVFSSNTFITTTDNLAKNNLTDSTIVKDYDKFCNFTKDNGKEIVYKVTGLAPAVPSPNHLKMANEFVGTNTVDISFNNNLFQITQIHNSILDNNANNITISCTDVEEDEDGYDVNFRTVANKATGIYFKDLQPYDFWFNKMKFDPAMLVKTTFAPDNTISINDGTGPIDYYVPIIPLIDGLNITGDIVGLGSTMRKPDDDFFNWEDAPSTLDRNISIESQYIPILGNPVFNDNEVQESGYYQIEVDAGINHTHIKGQQQQNNKIKAIISKFYDQNAYTSAYSEGSVTYQHTSDIPIELSQFRIRILNSKGELASQYEQLGDDNTVFMEIIRGSNQSN
tara:strand:- start:879 stop:2981 length:2103 start_codon:yes stop_codon:yes gene_type:complete